MDPIVGICYVVHLNRSRALNPEPLRQRCPILAAKVGFSFQSVGEIPIPDF